MSLLLDALKKAAEQKAQKSKREDLSQRASDETLLEADAAGNFAEDFDSAPLLRDDETEFEHTDIRARLERGERIAGDDTGLDISEFDNAARGPGQSPTTAGEETGLEYPDATSTGFSEAEPGARSAGEETGIEILESTPDPVPVPEQQTDDTGLNLPEEKPAGVDEPALSSQSPRDDTGLDIPQSDSSPVSKSDQQSLSDDDETIVAEADDSSEIEVDQETGVPKDSPPSDETDLSLIDRLAEEARERDSAALPGSDQTDISMPVSSADEIASASPELPPSLEGLELVEKDDFTPDGEDAGSDDKNVLTDEDMSLLLIEPEQVGPDGITSFTNPQVPVDRARTQTRNGANRAEAEPGDITERKKPAASTPEETTNTQGTTLTNVSQTAIYGDETRAGTLAAPTRNKVTRPTDATSTHTYAPDNYDRTLMKLPSDDASDLFAGMKPESDVVMTPDYAKKVFRSKTSAQRVQHYKYYAGIAIALFLAIAIYGGIGYQDESDLIDSRMRPLKRDPMPGLIRPKQVEETNLFAATEKQADARTIEIIETAETAVDESSPDTIAMIESAETDTAAEMAIESQAGGVTGVATDTDVSRPEIAEPETGTAKIEVEPEPLSMEVVAATEAMTDGPAMVEPEPQQLQIIASSGKVGVGPDLDGDSDTVASSSLQIKTSNAYRDVDIWTREAYEAYQAGNNSLALTRYNRVLEVDPGNRNALLGRAAINIQDGNIDSAIQDYRQLLLANPKDSLAMSSLLTVSSFSPRETESQLKLMIREEPDSPYLNFALANAYGAQNRWREAQGYYFTALQNKPEDPNYAYNLAVSLEHISQPVSAITYYRRALENINNGLATFSSEVVGQRLEVLEKP